jgi:hypothetical protein
MHADEIDRTRDTAAQAWTQHLQTALADALTRHTEGRCVP